MTEYIDREALLTDISKTVNDSGLVFHEDEIMDCIKYADAADVAPVVRGRWEFGTTQGHDWMKCSECLHSQVGWTGVFVYCPNCGAKMDMK